MLQSLVDLMGLYRVWNTQYNSWSIFGQDHLSRVLLGWDTTGEPHDACMDALKSMKLFNLYNTSLQHDADGLARAQVMSGLTGLHCPCCWAAPLTSELNVLILPAPGY